MVRPGCAVWGCSWTTGPLLFDGAPLPFDDPAIAAPSRSAYGAMMRIVRRCLNATRLAVGDLA